MFLETGKKVYTSMLREKKKLKSTLWVCTVLGCCAVIWKPSLLDSAVLAFLPEPEFQPLVPLMPSHPLFSQPSPAPPLAKMVHIPFVLNDHKCEELFHAAGFNFSYSEEFWDHIDAYKTFLSEMGMLSDSYTDEMTWVYHELSKTPTIKTVCDIGFGTGHKAFYCLAGRFDINLHSFEENVQNYTHDMDVFISSEFPLQFASHFGNLRTQIPKFFSENNTTQCDLILLDSSLDAKKMDFLLDTMKHFANPEQNFVILDAHPRYSRRSSLKSWDKARKHGTIVENFRCSLQADKANPMGRPNATGIMLGHFTPVPKPK